MNLKRVLNVPGLLLLVLAGAQLFREVRLTSRPSSVIAVAAGSDII